MREFQERRRVKKLLHSRYAIAVLVVVLLLTARGVWGVYQKYEKSKDIAERMRTEASSLAARQDSLQASIAALGTSEGREKEIRDRFGVVKPGEKMVVLVDTASTDEPIVPAEPEGLWARFWGLFGF